MKRYFQLIGASAVMFAVFFLDPSINVLNVACLLLILLFGIPHGALDHKVHNTLSSGGGVQKYIIKYLSISIGFVLWWVLMPFKALIMFLILSAFHFGQELLEDHGYKGRNVFTQLSWGAIILIVPLLIQYNEIIPFLETIGKTSLPVLDNGILSGVGLVVGLVGLRAIWQDFKKGDMERNALVRLVLCGVFIQVCYLMLPFIAAFTIYFLCFHSFNAFTHQYRWFKKSFTTYSVKQFLIDLSSFSLVAVIGMVALLWVMGPMNSENLISYFFMFTSLLTLPHAILFDQFYFERKEEKSVIRIPFSRAGT
ncbi:MAG: Brp/Blh family beta-carotene 15,15'-dioxygenase [Bacteroidota bacterium]